MADERIPFRNAPWSSYRDTLAPMDRASSFVRSQLYGGEDQLPQQDDAAGMLTGKQAALFGAGMAPGAGAASAAGMFPRAEGGYEPSMMDDFRAGNIGSGLIKGAGAVGDALYATGLGAGVGGMLKAPLAAKLAMAGIPKAARAAKQDRIAAAVAKSIEDSVANEGRVLSDAEQAFMNNWGSKHDFEARNLKKAERLGALPKEGKKNVYSAVEPTIFRQMAKDPAQGEDAVIKAAQAGSHLKPTGVGGFVGGPRTITNTRDLNALRKKLDNEVVNSVQAVELADPERMGTWYQRAKGGMNATNEPWQLQYTLDNHGAYSAGVSPESELGFALKHWNSRMLGEPAMAFRSAPMNNLDKAHNAGEIASLADKTDEYRAKLDPRYPVSGLFGVNDFRAAQNFGFTNAQGKPWKAAVSGTMHPFMDAETALLTHRMNTSGIGHNSNWSGPQMQELPWVYQKAQDIYRRGQNARFAGDPIEGRKAAIREANNTFEDYLWKHAGSGTYELTPGASTEHAPQIIDMPDDVKTAYGNVGRWDVEAPSVTGELGAGRRDALYSALGLRQLPTIDGFGAYENMAKEVEGNPLKIARPLIDYPTKGQGQIAPLTEDVLHAIERFRGVNDAQEAYAFNMPNTMKAAKDKTGVLADTRPRGEPATGMQLSKEQMAALNASLKPLGFGATATSRGALGFPFAGTSTLKERNAAQKAMKQIVGDVSVMPARPNTGYGPAIGKWNEAGDEIVPTAPYSGEATSQTLQGFVNVPQEVATKVSESEDVRKALQAKIARDEMVPNTRGDIQNMRQFFADGKWPQVVALMRKGMPPAAAMAALGYSLEAMAGEDQPR